MKKTIITMFTWLALVLLMSEITRLAYNHIYYPAVLPDGQSYDSGAAPNLLLLSIYIISFSLAGVVMSWRMKGNKKSITISMSIGVVWLAFEATFYAPVFILQSNHPSTYDLFITFIGTLTPPFFCALGSYIYCHYTYKK